MKKLLLLPLLLLPSCKSNETKFYLEDKYYNHAQLINLESIDDFILLEEQNESFGIFVHLPGCITCATFKPILEEYISDTEITLYSISYMKVKDKKNTLKENIDYTPSVALFNKGELVTYLDAINNQHIPYYESKEGFINWFESYVIIK